MMYTCIPATTKTRRNNERRCRPASVCWTVTLLLICGVALVQPSPSGAFQARTITTRSMSRSGTASTRKTTPLYQSSVPVPLTSSEAPTRPAWLKSLFQRRRVWPQQQPAAVSTETKNIPSYPQLLSFWSTTLLIWLSEPLLSLVDTTVVGLSQPMTQLAAMGPATTLMDTGLYCTYFLAISTTTQLTKYLAVNDKRQLQRTISHVLGVAAVVGLMVSGVLGLAGPSLLAGMGASPVLAGMAAQYCWIRGAVAPITIMGMVSQAFCLATLDTKTPAVAVLVASVVNVVGDVLLTPVWGMQGAAAATAVASVSASAILLRAVWKQVRQWRREEVQEACNTDSSSAETSVPPPVPFLSLPDATSLWNLWKLSFPLAFTMWSKMASYTALTVAATPFGVTAMAAHNVLMRVFFFFGCFADSLGQAAQSFLPSTLYPTFRPKAFAAIRRRLSVLAVATAGLIGWGSCRLLQTAGQYLANDGGVVATLSHTSPWVGLALALHPLIVLQEGTVIATRSFASLIKTYVVTLAVHGSLLRFGCHAFVDVWKVLCAFQVVRLLNYKIWGRRNVANNNDCSSKAPTEAVKRLVEMDAAAAA